MRYLQENAATGELERGLKNKWRWQWIEETDSQGQKYEVWLAKVDIPGMAWCRLCNKNIAYAQNGKRVFACHAEDRHHREMVSQQQHTQSLPGAQPVAAPVSCQDQREDLKAITAAFVAEHCLPFSLAPHLVEYAKRMSESKNVLSGVTLSRQTCAYYMTHGVAKTLKGELVGKVRKAFCSLNIDEATNNANDKNMNILERFFDEELGRVTTEHLGAKSGYGLQPVRWH